MTVINASAAVTLLEQRPEKIQALSGIPTQDDAGDDAGAVLSQPSYQSHMHESGRMRVSPYRKKGETRFFDCPAREK